MGNEFNAELKMIYLVEYICSTTRTLEQILDLSLMMFLDIAQMHRQGIVHGHLSIHNTRCVVIDEKPIRLILQQPGTSVCDDNSITGRLMNAMDANNAPEIKYEGNQYLTELTDIFNGGEIMYYMLFGERYRYNKYFDTPKSEFIKRLSKKYGDAYSKIYDQLADFLSICLIQDYLYRPYADEAVRLVADILALAY